MTRSRTDVDLALDQIQAGAVPSHLETPALDFKEDKASPAEMEKIIAQAAICFANSAGGAIIVGVADKVGGARAFTGTSLNPDRIRQRVYELSRPQLTVDALRHPKHADVIVVSVPQSAEIHADTQGRAYRRIGRDCIPMTPDQQMRLREERRGVDWSADSDGRSLEDVSAEAVVAARAILSRFPDERRKLAALGERDLLSAIGAVHHGGALNRAGALMFCKASHDREETIIYQHRLTPGGEPKLVQRMGTPMLLAFLRAMDFVAARQSLAPVTMPNGQQIAIEDFPSLAVREAISNAICHRDYHLSGPVVVDHSPEVFVVTSPGPLVAGVTPENIITTTSRPRNPALARIARNLGLAEELGRGVDRMYREMIRFGRQVPQIEADFDRVRVTFVGGAPDTQIARFVAGLPEHERDDTDTMLVLYRLCRDRTISAGTAASWLQKTPEEAEAVFRRLASDAIALLERTRATTRRSFPTYRLRSDALKRLGAAVLYQRRTSDDIDRKVIAHIREYGKITNRTLQNFFDVHVFKARDIITDLVQRDILVRVSPQQRGPKVEWGPGPKFPTTKARRSKASNPVGESGDADA